jgi:PAS domain S-box-containing protein
MADNDKIQSIDTTTGPDMAIALGKLQEEIRARAEAEQKLRQIQLQLEQSVLDQTAKYRESERKYRKLVEDTNDLIAHLNPRGRLTFINKAAQKILDLSPTEYKGLSIFPFIHPDDRKRVLAWWRQCLSDKASATFIELRQVNSKNGRIYDLQWSAVSSMMQRARRPA